MELIYTVPSATKMLTMWITTEMGATFHQRYYSAEAFAKGIGVVPGNEDSGGKLLNRHTSHGNQHVKFHFLSAVKAFVILRRGHLRSWFGTYRTMIGYFKAIFALSRRIAEAL